MIVTQNGLYCGFEKGLVPKFIFEVPRNLQLPEYYYSAYLKKSVICEAFPIRREPPIGETFEPNTPHQCPSGEVDVAGKKTKGTTGDWYTDKF